MTKVKCLSTDAKGIKVWQNFEVNPSRTDATNKVITSNGL